VKLLGDGHQVGDLLLMTSMVTGYHFHNSIVTCAVGC
jgi:hypothetical protein